MNNSPTILTNRLILRRFHEKDDVAIFDILSSREVNEFLPWFPLESIEEAGRHLRENYLNNYKKPVGFLYAICLKHGNVPIGYIKISDGDSHDLGYGLKTEHWHKGLVTEASKAVVEEIRKSGIPYITATHDVNNPRSGNVMKNIGMTYRYSYEEQWQPKNRLVTFRMYQLNFSVPDDWDYKGYWNKHPVHFFENET
ncbi:MAG: GNAT family N-acetyltransferase [Azoarcus sp.]|nr:GNAT family N-acetyltransferase [Azoarcus sp.]